MLLNEEYIDPRRAILAAIFGFLFTYTIIRLVESILDYGDSCYLRGQCDATRHIAEMMVRDE